MRVFGFASSLVETLALGLQTYNRARYRQLVKRIGHIIRSAHEMGNICLRKSWTHLEKYVICFSFRMTVCYVSDHWAEYVSAAGADGSSSHSLSLDKLQLEFDHLFLRAVLHVLKNKRLDIHLSLIILTVNLSLHVIKHFHPLIGWAYGCSCPRCRMGLSPALCCGKSCMSCSVPRRQVWRPSAPLVTHDLASRLWEVKGGCWLNLAMPYCIISIQYWKTSHAYFVPLIEEPLHKCYCYIS